MTTETTTHEPLSNCKSEPAKPMAAPVLAQNSMPATAAIPRGPLDTIAELLTRGVSPDQLEKYLAVQHAYEAEQARRAYHRAMAAFKAEPIGPIKKNKRVKFALKAKDQNSAPPPPLQYKHETLAQVVNAAIGLLAKHGLSHSWTVNTDRPTRVITVRCVMTHQDGHSEYVELPGLPDDSGQKNALQQMRSTITYLQRATLLLITGLAAEDGSDDDGRGAYIDGEIDQPPARASGKATAKQQALIKKKAGDDETLAKVLKKVDTERLEDLPFEKVNEVLQLLKG